MSKTTMNNNTYTTEQNATEQNATEQNATEQNATKPNAMESYTEDAFEAVKTVPHFAWPEVEYRLNCSAFVFKKCLKKFQKLYGSPKQTVDQVLTFRKSFRVFVQRPSKTIEKVQKKVLIHRGEILWKEIKLKASVSKECDIQTHMPQYKKYAEAALDYLKGPRLFQIQDWSFVQSFTVQPIALSEESSNILEKHIAQFKWRFVEQELKFISEPCRIEREEKKLSLIHI